VVTTKIVPAIITNAVLAHVTCTGRALTSGANRYVMVIVAKVTIIVVVHGVSPSLISIYALVCDSQQIGMKKVKKAKKGGVKLTFT